MLRKKKKELLFSAIIFWSQKLKHISDRNIRKDEMTMKMPMIILKTETMSRKTLLFCIFLTVSLPNVNHYIDMICI